MKRLSLISLIFSLLFVFSCEDKSSGDETVSCDEEKLEASMWAEYYKLIDELKTASGVTEATCTSTKAAIKELQDCIVNINDPDFKNDVNDASNWTNSVCN